MLWGGIVALWLLSTPAIGHLLLQPLEKTPPITAHSASAQAIVLLGGGRRLNAPEYNGEDTLSPMALERARYTAFLWRSTKLPILTSGGAPDGPGKTEGELLKGTLEQEFQAPVHWVETVSGNTSDEANACWQILSRENITQIYLVTHAWHMPRAVAAFKKTGFSVIPAPMGYHALKPFSAQDLVPQNQALGLTRIALHEYIGLLWYKIKGVS